MFEMIFKKYRMEHRLSDGQKAMYCLNFELTHLVYFFELLRFCLY